MSLFKMLIFLSLRLQVVCVYVFEFVCFLEFRYNAFFFYLSFLTCVFFNQIKK